MNWAAFRFTNKSAKGRRNNPRVGQGLTLGKGWSQVKGSLQVRGRCML